MDMLYQKYSNSLEFMRLYIKQDRFGEFVTEIINLESKSKKEKIKKEDEEKLWQLYLHSMPDKSFSEWQSEIINNAPQDISDKKVKKSSPLVMSKEDADRQKEKARSLLKSFSIS